MVSEHIIFFVRLKLEIDKNFTVCHYNFTSTLPKMLTWTTSPKGGKDRVLVNCDQKNFIVYHNLMCSQSICQFTQVCLASFQKCFHGGAFIIQISIVMKIAT